MPERKVIDKYSSIERLYAKVAKTGYKKFVYLNDRYSYLKPSTKGLVSWKSMFEDVPDGERVNTKRTNQNSSKRVIV
jgi:hypothetical protein